VCAYSSWRLEASTGIARVQCLWAFSTKCCS